VRPIAVAIRLMAAIRLSSSGPRIAFACVSAVEGNVWERSQERFLIGLPTPIGPDVS
jgi:hypothetical protein